MNSHNNSRKTSTPVLKSTRLLDQLREQIRYLHYSARTEEAYVYWVKKFVHFHELKHPRDMGREGVETFLTYLATQRKVSVSTHRQALSALLFLYRNVLGVDLPWLAEVQRPTRPRRIPSVLTKTEVGALLGAMEGETALLAKLLSIHARGLSAGTISTKSGCSAPSNGLLKVAAGGTASPLDALGNLV